ncbi:MAG: glycoside hydrolase family 99-like domain-containing protein [Planctomycetota bacterium]
MKSPHRQRGVCRAVVLAGLIFVLPCAAPGQEAERRAMLGAYYFGGWSGHTHHVTDLLRTEYADRQPVWGWETNSVNIVQQIDYCADHGMAFWSFCWYYPEGEDKATPLNHGLDLYLEAPNRERLKFCLLVANHGGFRIGPNDWNACCERWVELFQQPTHLRVDGKPLITFFLPGEIWEAFDSVQGVRKALDSLRAKAKEAGLPGVTVAACTGPSRYLNDLKNAGFDVLTGYNYNLTWKDGAGSRPFKTLIDGNAEIFDRMAKQTPLPYIPAVMAGWDRRPWEQGKLPPEKLSGWYPDRSPKQVEEFVRLGVRWLDEHPNKATPQRLLLIYAWNELGEGGYLTPTAADGTDYLEAVERAITVAK